MNPQAANSSRVQHGNDQGSVEDQQQYLEELPAYGIVEELAAPYAARHRMFAANAAPPLRQDQNPVGLFANTYYQQNPPETSASAAAAPPPPPPPQRFQAPLGQAPVRMQPPPEAFMGSSEEPEPDYGLVAELRGQNAAQTLVPGFGMAAEVSRLRKAHMLQPLQPGSGPLQPGAGPLQPSRPRVERMRMAPAPIRAEEQQQGWWV